MSRGIRERRLEAAERWPDLVQFLSANFHQDCPMEAGTPDRLVDRAISETDLAERQLVLKQCVDWNNAVGWQAHVIAALNDGLGVDVHFASELDARQFMNMVYDKLIVSVRVELGAKWRPS